MGSKAQPLHILFFPLMAPGHMIPMLDMARLFTARGVRATIITTPANAPLIRPNIDRANGSGRHQPIALVLLPFPSAAVGLPEGCENMSSVTSPDLMTRFIKATEMLRQPFDQVLGQLLPDCIVTDMFFPWTVDAASEHGLPRLLFHGTCFFTHCAKETLDRHGTIASLPPDAESFVLPGLPNRIEMLRSQFPDLQKSGPSFVELFKQIKESDQRSYGLVVNSFYELEPDYAQHYREVVGRRAWHVGPVSLCNTEEADMSGRGNKASIDGGTCLEWLDSKKPGSVLYVCFGSLGDFTAVQLRQIALGLAASHHPFIWVVRNGGGEVDWLPETYEESIEGKGLLIRGWAPQILILNHPAVGGFLTHCGWNSSLEGVSAGVPMVTWPLSAEQFYNERLIMDVLGIGVAIGVKKRAILPEDRPLVESAEIERAVDRLMGGGEEADGRRRRAGVLKAMAKKAVEEGGSSFVDLGNLIQELMDRRPDYGQKLGTLQNLLSCVPGN